MAKKKRTYSRKRKDSLGKILKNYALPVAYGMGKAPINTALDFETGYGGLFNGILGYGVGHILKSNTMKGAGLGQIGNFLYWQINKNMPESNTGGFE